MSTYYELLREEFDDSANAVTVLDVIKDKENKCLILNMSISRMLNYGEYKKFKEINDKIFKHIGCDYLLNIKYDEYSNNASVYFEYFDNIVEDLSRKSVFYNIFKEFKKDYLDNLLTVYVDNLNETYTDCANEIEKRINDLSIPVKIKLEVSEDARKAYDDMIQAEEKQVQDALENQVMLSREANKAKELSFSKKDEKKYKNVYETININNIPSNMDELSLYKNEVGDPIFKIVGTVFQAEVRELKKSVLFTGLITDKTDTISFKRFLRGEDNIAKGREIEKMIADNKQVIVEMTGHVEYDEYAKDVIFAVNDIDVLGLDTIAFPKDDAPVKRVELSVHTKMSNLDGLNEAAEYLAAAASMGHTAVGFTDHNGVYAIPKIAHAHVDGVKPLYGCDFDYIDDEDFHITYTDEDIDLKKATYVVFDIEATGLSQTYSQIIEISAYKMCESQVIDTYEVLIDPECVIPDKIRELTSIDDSMVKGKPKIKEALEKFLEFSKGCILVAHNADYDIGMIHAKIRQCGFEDYIFPGIDTLNLFRALHYDTEKHFGLKALSKYYKVKQEHHHRAIDDTRVLCECFIYMLQDVYAKNITNYNELKNLITDDVVIRSIPSRMSVIAKNQVGYKNLFKLVSDALTTHVFGDARLLRSVINKYSEGIITLSGNSFSDVFDYALNGSIDDLRRVIRKYDVIEVQSPKALLHIINELNDGNDGKKIVEEVIKKIISVAKEEGKPVCATGECYYILKEDKRYRDILIDSPKVGGGFHELKDYKVRPDAHFRTTTEMLNEFDFLPYELAEEIVIKNTNMVADWVENIQTFHKEMFVPADDEFADHPDPALRFPSMIQGMQDVVAKNMLERYGKDVHPYVKARIERELKAIISSGYYSTYFMAYLMVKDSNDHGYLVGSRGSVGSSFAATMMGITEVNPLPPHYLCPKCKFMAIRFHPHEEANIYTEEERALQPKLRQAASGFDLEDCACPRCGEKMAKEGQDIPFETFLGFKGDKVPDIDLNFSGEYQPTAHLFVRKMMGYDNSFRGGTVGTIAEKNGYGYVKAYVEKMGLKIRNAEIDRISNKITNIRRSTGQHPGGIVVVPKRIDIFDVTPIQYPANDNTNEWRTTHFDYHSFEDNLLKLDVLGHDDPTLIKYFMDIVHEHQDEFPFSDPTKIPLDDKNVFGLFGSTSTIGVTADAINSPVASYAVPEFGTNFVRQMLIDTKPKTFAELVKISGLSHGTGVWLGNAKDLVDPTNPTGFGVIPFEKIIGCRDDIMVDLIAFGMEPSIAFKIMEFVRKNKKVKDPKGWEDFKAAMRAGNVPEYYIWACEQIEYMFPKAHAVAYVIMALRIAWFKVYKPALFYSAYLSRRAKAHSVEGMLQSSTWIKNKIASLQAIRNKTAKDEDLITSLQVVLEAKARGINFLPIDINESDSLTFKIEGSLTDGALRIPFVAVDGLGDAAAVKIVESRNERAFTSVSDIETRKVINKTLFDEFRRMGAFNNLPEEDDLENVGLFAL